MNAGGRQHAAKLNNKNDAIPAYAYPFNQAAYHLSVSPATVCQFGSARRNLPTAAFKKLGVRKYFFKKLGAPIALKVGRA